jgi:hypothetical protein
MVQNYGYGPQGYELRNSHVVPNFRWTNTTNSETGDQNEQFEIDAKRS